MDWPVCYLPNKFDLMLGWTFPLLLTYIVNNKMRILLIRHGETHKNMDKKTGSRNVDKNSDLNTTGIKQSVNTGLYLASLSTINKKFIIISSPTKRTQHTSTKILETLTEKVHDIDITLDTDDRISNHTTKDTDNITHNVLSLINDIYPHDNTSILVLVTHNHIIETLYKHLMDNDDSYSDSKFKPLKI